MIAENLGVITPAVERLRHELGFPGMVVVEFAFEGGAANPHALASHRPADVVYTGTHDHQPLAAWYAAQPRGVRAQIPLDGDGAALGADPPRPRLAGAPRDPAGAGRPRPRRGGAA